MMVGDFDIDGNLIPFQPPNEWINTAEDNGWYILPYYFSVYISPIYLSNTFNAEVQKIGIKRNGGELFCIRARCNNEDDMNRLIASALQMQLKGSKQIPIFTINSITGIREGIFKAFESAKKVIQSDPPNNFSCNYIVQVGKKRRNSGKGCRFNRLESDDLNVTDFQEISTNEYIRYDIVVVTPRPLLKIRYHLFLKKSNQDGYQMRFLSLEEAEVNAQEYIDPSPGHGCIPNIDKPVYTLNVEQGRGKFITILTN